MTGARGSPKVISSPPQQKRSFRTAIAHQRIHRITRVWFGSGLGAGMYISGQRIRALRKSIYSHQQNPKALSARRHVVARKMATGGRIRGRVGSNPYGLRWVEGKIPGRFRQAPALSKDHRHRSFSTLTARIYRRHFPISVSLFVL